MVKSWYIEDQGAPSQADKEVLHPFAVRSRLSIVDMKRSKNLVLKWSLGPAKQPLAICAKQRVLIAVLLPSVGEIWIPHVTRHGIPLDSAVHKSRNYVAVLDSRMLATQAALP